MILVSLVGVLSGDFLLFSLGRRFGHQIMEHRLFRKLVNPSRLVKAERLFERRGFRIIFFGRFLPGLRPMLWVACGVSRVPAWIFATTNGAAACISVPTLVLLGKWFGHSIHKVQQDVRNVMYLILLIAVVAALAGTAYYIHKQQRGLLSEDAGADAANAVDKTKEGC
jgi:membrane protein DedA with SNARE-associated domain